MRPADFLLKQDETTIYRLLNEAIDGFLIANNFTSANQLTHEPQVDVPPAGLSPSRGTKKSWVPAFGSVISVKSAVPFTLDDDMSIGARKRTSDNILEVEGPTAKKVRVSGREEGTEYEVWNDPVSQKKFFMDVRTGNS